MVPERDIAPLSQALPQTSAIEFAKSFTKVLEWFLGMDETARGNVLAYDDAAILTVIDAVTRFDLWTEAGECAVVATILHLLAVLTLVGISSPIMKDWIDRNS